MIRCTTTLGTISLLGLIAAPSMATVTIFTDTSTPQAIVKYGNIYTSGADMDGMLVDVTYSDNTHGEFTWATTTNPGGGVSGGGFSLAFAGSDTFFTPWTLSNTGKGITDIKLDGYPGLTLFDRTPPTDGTAGSPGKTFVLQTGGTGYHMSVTYSGPIGVGGAPPIGPPTDVYRWLDIGFTNKPFANSNLSFLADTDNIVLPAVPEASSKISFGLLLALGLGGVMIAAKRKKARE